MDPVVPRDERFLRSRFYEQLVEYVFISELLQEAWFRFEKTVEVLRAEVDTAGYDLVLECNGVIRHVQLRTSAADARKAYLPVNVALAEKPSGCVVWLVREEKGCRVRLRYRYFGSGPGEPLPSLDEFRVGRHTGGDSRGVKKVRPTIRLVPKSRFEEIEDTAGLLDRLFGLGK